MVYASNKHAHHLSVSTHCRCMDLPFNSARARQVWCLQRTLEQGIFHGRGYQIRRGLLSVPWFVSCLLALLLPDQMLINRFNPPGDPLRYHSHFVASVIDSPTSNLRPMEIVAHGRLGTATKKAHLLCGWDDEKLEVSYFSIEWAGFG